MAVGSTNKYRLASLEQWPHQRKDGGCRGVAPRRSTGEAKAPFLLIAGAHSIHPRVSATDC